jgi:phage shock protein PspC (stress-responsive transcriptional regulator)
MNDDTPTIEQPKGDEPEPRRLRRSSSDRMLTGVSGGLGQYFGIDPVIFRIGFAISVFFGGLGAGAYALLALFVPTDGEPDWAQRVGRRLHRLGIWRALLLALIVVLALGALSALAGGAAFAVALGWGVPVAIGIVAIGLVLVLAAFRGGARWLILPAVALAIGAGVASAADLDFRGGLGEREYHPLTVSSIPADGYKLGVGHLAVDLREIDWKKDDVVHLEIDLGTGQADVFVPERVCVEGTTHVGVGESEVAGEQNDGFDVDHAVGRGSHAEPRLELVANVDIGQLRVINSDTALFEDRGYGRGPFDEELAPQRAAEARACATG